MFLAVANGLMAVCMLSNFQGLPSKIEGPVVMRTKKFIVLRIENKDKSQAIELTVASNKCEIKK